MVARIAGILGCWKANAAGIAAANQWPVPLAGGLKKRWYIAI
jgi:hypothetical protein